MERQQSYWDGIQKKLPSHLPLPRPQPNTHTYLPTVGADHTVVWTMLRMLDSFGVAFGVKYICCGVSTCIHEDGCLFWPQAALSSTTAMRWIMLVVMDELSNCKHIVWTTNPLLISMISILTHLAAPLLVCVSFRRWCSYHIVIVLLFVLWWGGGTPRSRKCVNGVS